MDQVDCWRKEGKYSLQQIPKFRLSKGGTLQQDQTADKGKGEVFASCLMKQRKSSHDFQKRWFVLDYNSNTVSYYENESSFRSGKPSRGDIALMKSGVRCEASTTALLAFNLITNEGQSDERVYRLQALDLVSRTAWINELELALNLAKVEDSLYQAPDINDHTLKAGWRGASP